jgi:hypothetical protein
MSSQRVLYVDFSYFFILKRSLYFIPHAGVRQGYATPLLRLVAAIELKLAWPPRAWGVGWTGRKRGMRVTRGTHPKPNPETADLSILRTRTHTHTHTDSKCERAPLSRSPFFTYLSLFQLFVTFFYASRLVKPKSNYILNTGPNM